MSILDKIGYIEQLCEMGMPNIRDKVKGYKEAVIYFHKDLDGVSSGLAMKSYLQQYGIKTVEAIPINYGSDEFSAKMPSPGVLPVMVDFAHSKFFIKIHTDHHDAQVGTVPGQSTSFVKTPSNAEYISGNISPRDIFPPEDIKLISMVDSADFAKHGLQPDDIMRAAFHYNKNLDVTKNRQAMGLVVNKLLLAFKGKPGFLSSLLLQAQPSLISMYNVIIRLAKENGYKAPEEVQADHVRYQGEQQGKAKGQGKISDIEHLGNGQSVMIGNVVIQYGGGNMMKGGYDRYTVFKVNPEAEALIIMWPMGLIQMSKNPFKRGSSSVHMGDVLLRTVAPKFKSQMSREISLADVKRTYEMDITKKGLDGAMGFTFKDLAATLKPEQIRGVDVKEEGGWNKVINDISTKLYKDLSFKQKELLDRIKVNTWDIIMSGSGGHSGISNLQGLNFLGKGYTDLMKKIAMEAAKEMKDFKLS